MIGNILDQLTCQYPWGKSIIFKGDLSDEQIAQKVARRFFAALIDKDYATAGKLMEGMPADFMQEHFGKTTYLRIVSIGKPYPHSDPDTHFLCVPCEVEVEIDGVKTVEKPVPNIRSVYSSPEYWTIGGGIWTKGRMPFEMS